MSHRRRNRAHPMRMPWPSELTWAEWRDVLVGVLRSMGDQPVTVNASAISFLALFAIFSAISAFVAFYGLFADPGVVVADMRALSGFVPADVVISMIEQMKEITSRSTSTLWAAGIFSLLVALWCAQQGVAALMIALDAAYTEGPPRRRSGALLRSFCLALAVIAGLIVVSLMAIGLPVWAQIAGASLALSELIRAIGMTLGGLVLFFGLAALYRWVPDRAPPPRWRWVRIGAGVVVSFWTVASILFSVFMGYSDSYTAMYGSLSGVVLLLTLTYVTVVTVIVGAEFNARIEREARQRGRPAS